MLYFKFIISLVISINLYANNLVVIVSKDSNIHTISKKELSKIFLSKTRKLPNGEKSFLVESNDKEIQSRFYKEISNKNENQLRKYWTKMIFTGKGQPPKKMNTISEIIKYVANTKNAISYIPSQYVNNSIQTIMEIK